MTPLTEARWRKLAEWLGLPFKQRRDVDAEFFLDPSPPAQDSPATFLAVLKALAAKYPRFHLYNDSAAGWLIKGPPDADDFEYHDTPEEALLLAAYALMEQDDKER